MPKKKGHDSSADPSPTFMSRMLGSNGDEWPELQKQFASAQINMPRESRGITARPMNRLERFASGMLPGGITAMNYPGTIAINRQATEEDNNLRDTLVHELTHRGQPPRGIGSRLMDLTKSWEKRDVEIEANEAERTYPWKQARSDRKLK